MKQIRLLILVTLVTMSGLASITAQPGFGLKAGLNMANLNFTDVGFDPDLTLLPTFMVGAIVEFDLSENIGLGTGLQYHGKGAKDADDSDNKITMSYVQVPIQLQYGSGGFFAGVGPYVGFAIGGKTKSAGGDEDLEFGNDVEDDFSSLDYGINLEAGYEFNQLRVTASYGLGLANTLPGDLKDILDEGSIKHSVIGVAVAYLFGTE